ATSQKHAIDEGLQKGGTGEIDEQEGASERDRENKQDERYCQEGERRNGKAGTEQQGLEPDVPDGCAATLNKGGQQIELDDDPGKQNDENRPEHPTQRLGRATPIEYDGHGDEEEDGEVDQQQHAGGQPIHAKSLPEIADLSQAFCAL